MQRNYTENILMGFILRIKFDEAIHYCRGQVSRDYNAHSEGARGLPAKIATDHYHHKYKEIFLVKIDHQKFYRVSS